MESDVLEVAVVWAICLIRNLGRFGMARVVTAGLRTANGLKNLRSGGRRLGDDIQAAITPVRRHLASAGAGIVSGADGLQKHLQWLGPESQAQAAVAIIRIEPVVPWLKRLSRSHADRLMASTRHLEEDFLLPLEHNLPVIDAAGGVHEAVDVDQLLTGKSLIITGLPGYWQREFKVGFCGRHPVSCHEIRCPAS